MITTTKLKSVWNIFNMYRKTQPLVAIIFCFNVVVVAVTAGRAAAYQADRELGRDETERPPISRTDH